jgi:hypothetical protein
MADGSDGGTPRVRNDKDRIVFGNRHASVLCNLPRPAQLDLVAEGLPITLASAQGFWDGAMKLKASREARVLEGFCEEECAKIMILMDLVRCPQKLVSRRVGKLTSIFYDHLGRLIYADAQGWKPMHMTQLRDYVDHAREGHYCEGYAGEYIVPNASRYRRESTLYADVELYEDGVPHWSAPLNLGAFSMVFPPMALTIAQAMSALGLFDRRGIQAVSEIWNQVEFAEAENFEDTRRLTSELFARLDAEKLVSETATEQHVGAIANDWQMPMYNLEFRELPMKLADLRAQQEAMLWAEIGYEDGGY